MGKKCFSALCTGQIVFNCDCNNIYICAEHYSAHMQQPGSHCISKSLKNLSSELKKELIQSLFHKIQVFQTLSVTISQKSSKILSLLLSKTKEIQQKIQSETMKLSSFIDDLSKSSVFSNEILKYNREKNCDFVLNCNFPSLFQVENTISEYFSYDFLSHIESFPNFSQDLSKKSLIPSSFGPGHFKSPDPLTQYKIETCERVILLKDQYNLHVWSPGEATCILISKSDSNLLVSGGTDGVIILWDIIKQAMVCQLRGHMHKILQFCISPNGKTLCSTSLGKDLLLWNMKKKEKQASFHLKHLVNCLDITKNNEFIVAGNATGRVLIFNLSNCALEHQLKLPKTWGSLIGLSPGDRCITCMSFSNDFLNLITGHHHGSLVLWDLKNKIFISEKKNHPITSISISQINENIATGGPDGKVYLWTGTMQKIATFVGHEKAVTCIQITQDNLLIISASQDHTIRIWSIIGRCQEFVFTQHRQVVSRFYIFKDNRTVVSLGNEDCVMVWSLVDHKVLKKVQEKNVFFSELCVSDEKIAYCASDGSIRVSFFNENLVLKGHHGTVEHLVHVKDSKYVVSAGSDGVARVWNLQSRRQEMIANKHFACQKEYPFIDKILVSDDKKKIFSSCTLDKTIKAVNIFEKNVEFVIDNEEDFEEISKNFPEIQKIKIHFE